MGIIYGDGEGSMDVLLQEEKQNSYTHTHIKNVMISFFLLYTPEKVRKLREKGYINEIIISELKKQLIYHDMSKFSKEEWEPYRKRWFPTDDEKRRMKTEDGYEELVKEEFEIAWQHHYMNNAHHPEHWRYRLPTTSENDVVFANQRLDIATPMDLVSIHHMICDWNAMGLNSLSSMLPIDWYTSDKAKDEREAFNPTTKQTVEEILSILYGIEVWGDTNGQVNNQM